jgi:CheY-like chemotaxis protein
VSQILVIDDDETVRDVVRQLLERDDHEVTECEEGETGLESHAANPADLVVVDIQMPGISGFEVIRRLRQVDQEVKIIGVAGHTEALLQEAIEVGADRIMGKPLRLHPFLDMVNKLLDL